MVFDKNRLFQQVVLFSVDYSLEFSFSYSNSTFFKVKFLDVPIRFKFNYKLQKNPKLFDNFTYPS